MKIELSNYFKEKGFRSAYLFVNNMGRNCVELVHKEPNINGKRQKRFISYAKYLWISANNCEVPKGMEVYHINNNPKDDRIENLQILSQLENIQKEFRETGRQGILVVDLICPVCGVKFTKRLAEAVKNAKKQQCCCSRRCSSKLQSKYIPFDRCKYIEEIKKISYKKCVRL